MVQIPPLHEPEPEPEWKVEYRSRLRGMAADAKKASEEWGRRWFLSLAIGNAGGLAAVASAVLSVSTSAPEKSTGILWGLIPPAWSFAVGLVCGAALPYCWTKRVEKISDWVYVREQELDDGGTTTISSGEDDVETSDYLLELYDAHKAKWSRIFTICERGAVFGFFAGLLWTLLFFTLTAICDSNSRAAPANYSHSAKQGDTRPHLPIPSLDNGMAP